MEKPAHGAMEKPAHGAMAGQFYVVCASVLLLLYFIFEAKTGAHAA